MLDRSDLPRLRRPFAGLQRLRGRGLPGRHRLGPPALRPTPPWRSGLTNFQALRFVVLPQAIRRVRPPLLNDFISLQKDVALVSVLGIQEAFRIAQIDAASTFNYTPLIAAALLYLAVTIPMARILDHITSRGEIDS